ncbi:MAG: SPOR domain-containing protein [Methylococcales bacterium]|nr:SPOR domain-containing protein [Methylococcales bacterium]MDD5753646.1 SPOR domain-containing protein [Methylococcales bacterium]
MDHELKQRLIGALVVTILSAIFIPMLFDDPIQEEGQATTTLALPSENQFVEEPTIKAPASSEQVLAIPQQPQIEVAALAPSTAGATQNTLRPDEMDESPVPKLQPKPVVKSPVAKSHVEKPTYSETTNYGVNADEVDDEPPMKPKLQSKEEAKKVSGKPEEELLKQMRAAKLLDDAPVKTIAPVDTSVAEVKKIIAPETKKASRWFIQVGSFTNKAKADGLLEGLKSQGLPALLEPVQTEKGTSYRLRVGPELDGKRAAAMKRKMDEQHINSILVSE